MRCPLADCEPQVQSLPYLDLQLQGFTFMLGYNSWILLNVCIAGTSFVAVRAQEEEVHYVTLLNKCVNRMLLWLPYLTVVYHYSCGNGTVRKIVPISSHSVFSLSSAACMVSFTQAEDPTSL